MGSGRVVQRASGMVDGLLGSPLISGTSRRITVRRLRILAYHGVADRAAFRRHMQHLLDRYTVVSATDVAHAVDGSVRLPPGAVWITFDDGDPSVLQNALPVLQEFGLPATLFVCPGVIGTSRPFWWEFVERFQSVVGDQPVRGITTPPEGWLRFLKAVEDDERRTIVDAMEDTMRERTGRSLERQQMSRADLEQFIAMGGSVGNHTWSHPCLNRCTPDRQEGEIEEAHRWLSEALGTDPWLFAYPNGDHTFESELILERLGYRVAVLFDHRVARTSQPPLRLSRIRTSDGAGPNRFVSLVSGAHPAFHGARSRLAR